MISIRVTVHTVAPAGHEKSDRKPAEPQTSSPKVVVKSTGFCIRTGVEIPFNREKPMCYEAYKAWSKYGNPDYPEKFCHFSGEPSSLTFAGSELHFIASCCAARGAPS